MENLLFWCMRKTRELINQKVKAMTKSELASIMYELQMNIKEDKKLLRDMKVENATISEAVKVQKRIRKYEKELRILRIRYNPQFEIFFNKSGK